MNIFSLDSPFVRFFEKVANLFILNFMLIICSLPIITIGPAITAVYAVALKMARNEEGGIVQEFLHSFRVNFKQGIVVGIIVFVVGAFCGLEIYWTYQLAQLGGLFDKFMLLFVLFLSVVYIMTVNYVWPLLAAYNNTTKQLFRTALALTVRHIVASIIMGITTAIPIFMLLYSLQMQTIAICFYLLLGIPAIAYLNGVFLNRIFVQYTPADSEEDEEDDEDEEDEDIQDEEEDINSVI